MKKKQTQAVAGFLNYNARRIGYASKWRSTFPIRVNSWILAFKPLAEDP
jgi:hypothetical protein